MNLVNLKSFPENRIKSLFGLEPEVLAEVVFRLLPVLEQNREHRLRTKNRKRRYVKGDGRPADMKPIHKLLIALLYLRHNTSAAVVGQMFGFSADSVEKNALPEVLAALKDYFPLLVGKPLNVIALRNGILMKWIKSLLTALKHRFHGPRLMTGRSGFIPAKRNGIP